MGPVAVFAAALLLCLAPLMRGGNRQIALIGLEVVAFAFLLSLWIRWAMGAWRAPHPLVQSRIQSALLWILLLSPTWLALIFLFPLPMDVWAELPGREIYPPLLREAGIAADAWLPISLLPDVTKASLLVGSLLVAGFLAGYASGLPQLKFLLSLVVGMALLQIVIGLLQVSGGGQSTLYFEAAGGRPVGTFANPNHLANYISVALAAYIWLGWSSLVGSQGGTAEPKSSFAGRQAQALWVAGGLLLVLGILMSQSRGAVLTGLPAAALAFGIVVVAGGRTLSWRVTVLLLSAVLVGAATLVGIGALLSRFELDFLSSSAEYRSLLGSTTMDGAKVFWPFGAGWGTYAEVYPLFQPAVIAGYADYAHQDYAQMLFEGGVFSLVLMGAFLWLAVSRAIWLVRALWRNKTFTPEEMAVAVCGLGLLGFLTHSLAEFNMHIPTNAIVGALLAGVYLRPMRRSEGSK